MHFLPDVFVACNVCQGKRFNRETLEVTYRAKSIADVLDMTVDQAVDFLEAVPPVRNKLVALQQVGLGYIHIGQQATTLSGGEAQRVKLAKELSRRATGNRLHPGRAHGRPAFEEVGSSSRSCMRWSTPATR